MTTNPDGPPQLMWVLQSRRPAQLGWSDEDDYYRINEARRDLVEKVARNPQASYRIIEATTTYRIIA